MTKGSWPHGDQMVVRWNSELVGGGGPESTGGNVCVEKLGKVLRSEAANGLKRKKNIINVVFVRSQGTCCRTGVL